VRFEVNNELPAFKLSNETPKIDDKIAIYGNSAGEGAITEERGEIKAIGTFRLEVTAHVVVGNSGSPVINGSGEVVGVYTYVTRGDSSNDFDMLDSRYKDGRKWAVRFTGVKWIVAHLTEHDTLSFAVFDKSPHVILGKGSAGGTSASGTVDAGKLASELLYL